MTKIWRIMVASLALSLPLVAWAEGEYIDLYPKTLSDINLILETLDGSINAGADAPPIVMMLHGPQAGRFLRGNYAANKALVDQTAKLAAYGVLEVRICQTWLNKNNHKNDELFPFVSPVPYGAGELARLQEEEGYTEFTVDL